MRFSLRKVKEGHQKHRIIGYINIFKKNDALHLPSAYDTTPIPPSGVYIDILHVKEGDCNY